MNTPAPKTSPDAALGNLMAAALGVPAAPDDTIARTGNTADHQAGWFAGMEQGQANAKDNAAIRAQAQEYGAPAEVAQRIEQYIGRYGREDTATLLLYEAMNALRRPAPATGDVRAVLPALNTDLIDILGQPNFACAGLATLLRADGHTIKSKAEHEQAAVIHFLLGHYLKHGSAWREQVGAVFEAIAANRGNGDSASGTPFPVASKATNRAPTSEGAPG